MTTVMTNKKKLVTSVVTFVFTKKIDDTCHDDTALSSKEFSDLIKVVTDHIESSTSVEMITHHNKGDEL